MKKLNGWTNPKIRSSKPTIKSKKKKNGNK